MRTKFLFNNTSNGEFGEPFGWSKSVDERTGLSQLVEYFQTERRHFMIVPEAVSDATIRS